MLEIIVFVDVWFKNGSTQSYAVFYGEFENEKKNGQKIFDLPEQGFEPEIKDFQ